eukprot:1205550-Rhodomonas_salina.1
MEMESASTTSSAHSQTRLKSSAEDLHLKSVSARLKSRMLAAADTRVSACASALLSPAPHWLATAASGNRQGLGLRRWRTSRCFVTHGQHAVPETATSQISTRERTLVPQNLDRVVPESRLVSCEVSSGRPRTHAS